jgi:hypothetical protein
VSSHGSIGVLQSTESRRDQSRANDSWAISSAAAQSFVHASASRKTGVQQSA